MNQIPLLTNKDVKRINGKLVVVVPDGSGGYTPLQSKDTTPEGGRKLLQIANAEVDSFNKCIKLYSHWEHIAKLAGIEFFDILGNIDERLQWKHIKPSLERIKAEIRINGTQNLILILAACLYYKSRAYQYLEIKEDGLVMLIRLKRHEKRALLKFIEDY